MFLFWTDHNPLIAMDHAGRIDAIGNPKYMEGSTLPTTEVSDLSYMFVPLKPEES